MVGSLLSADWTSPWTFVFHSDTGMLITVDLQAEQALRIHRDHLDGRRAGQDVGRADDQDVRLAVRVLDDPVGGGLAGDVERRVTSAVTPAAQPSQAGGLGDESS